MNGYLPDFCANQAVFRMIIIAELLALVLALATADSAQDFWAGLGLLSFFVQWIVLSSAAALCFFGPHLKRLAPLPATLAAYGLTQIATLLCSLAAGWAAQSLRLETFSAEAGSVPALLRNLAVSSIAVLVALRYFYVQHQWRENVEAEARARLQALQARIRPHFLFNSMNTIASLTASRPEQAEQALLDLADLFRTALAQADRTSLSEELETARRYLRLEALRLGERLQVDWQIDGRLPLEARLPALILQPLLENAVYYGIQPALAGGRIAIRVEARDRQLVFTVSNSLPAATTRSQGSGMAQDNVRQRLALAYGEASRFQVRVGEDRYSVCFAIPREALR